MKKYIYPSFLLMFSATLLLGFLYPLATTFVAQKLFPFQAKGSLIYQDDKCIGSELIGQEWTNAKYFWGRPSASHYDPLSSGATNLAPINSKLKENIQTAVKRFENQQNIPSDLLFYSASGLDPHLSLNATLFQMARVSKELKISEDKLKKLVYNHLEKKDFNILGNDRVNILKLNLALDKGINGN